MVKSTDGGSDFNPVTNIETFYVRTNQIALTIVQHICICVIMCILNQIGFRDRDVAMDCRVGEI